MPRKQNPVLFVYIGWADRYDGTEPILGSHGFLAGNADDCSEIEAFRRRDGAFRCGIGSGEIGAERLDIVFVAKRKGESVRRVVGYYLDATVESPEDASRWRWASARKAHWLPIPKRIPVPEWPGSSGMRRWAHLGADGVRHESLFRIFRRLRNGSLAIPAGTKTALAGDEELAER